MGGRGSSSVIGLCDTGPMRRSAPVIIAMLALAGLVGLPGVPAVADPSPAATLPVPKATPGTEVCTVDDRLSAIVGLVATDDGYAVAVRSNDAGLNLKVYPLTDTCKLTGTTVPYSGNPRGGPIDPEDLALSKDGKDYWVADTGDDLAKPARDHVAVWKLPVDGDQGTIYRFTYPDGPHDAEALLLSGDGTPILVTRELSGPAGIYVPSAPLDPSGKEVPLKKAGEFMPQKTDTPNILGAGGQLSVTGGAVSPDGTRAVLRTVSDAYQWKVPDGDVVKAITTGTPTITPLGDDGVGRAIAYTPDGKSFLTVPDVSSSSEAKILKYQPAVAPPPGSHHDTSTGQDDGKSWLATISLRQLTLMVVGVGALGLVLVIAGLLGMRYGRRRPRSGKAGSGKAGSGKTGSGKTGGSARATAGVRAEGSEAPGRSGGYPRQPDRDSADARPDGPPSPGSPARGGRVYGAAGGRAAGATYGHPADRGVPPGRVDPRRGRESVPPGQGAGRAAPGGSPGTYGRAGSPRPSGRRGGRPSSDQAGGGAFRHPDPDGFAGDSPSEDLWEP